ncbi:hypothetical protein JZ751_026221 [Albula glossodonta]|uniref:N-acetylglucosamine-1-phosphate transferase subunit gamma n=1 Tax=Albula glossodonta TaxID=121402 RepID=A0A8T2PK17_9TELE|nr:hypothetical protein JZ751_026221 [Albula glossodonta]
MWMREGDSCGSKSRQTKVILSCGVSSKLAQVSEPSTCVYSLTFETPLVCHPHSLLVYPTLSEKLQKEWDEAEQARYEELITEQGHNNLLKDIFEEAGFLKTQRVTEKKDASSPTKKFESLEKCNEGFQKQKEEIERLQALLTQHNIPHEKQPAEKPQSPVNVAPAVVSQNSHLRGDTGLLSDLV